MAVLLLAASGRAQPTEAPAPTPEVEDFSGGYSIAGTGLWLGGDATLEIRVPKDGAASAFVEPELLLRWEPTPTLAFFTETKLDEPVTWTSGRGVERGSRVLAIERLYLDWNPLPELTARGGKFLTPFGLWNQIRRAPLAWTVERPVVTERFFPEHATGLQLLYQTGWRGWSLDATAYGPAQDELSLTGDDDESGSIAGGRVAVGRAFGPAWVALGLNGAGIADGFADPWHAVGGFDLDVTAFGHLLTSELYYGPPRTGRTDNEWGFYLQDAIPLADGLHGVLRFEHYDGPGDALEAGVFGVAWRPWRHLILKVDYQAGNRDVEDYERGFFASVTLFY